MDRVPREADGRPPALVISVELEELPRVRIDAQTFEDEVRLRRWLKSTAARRRLYDALLDGLDELAA